MAEQKVKLTQLPEATDTIDAAVLLVNQNETDQRLPITHFLRSKNNLSELENNAQARANLGVPSVEDVNDKFEYLIDGKNTFLNGATLESERDFIWDDNSKSWYYWTGVFSKEVPAASTPESTGGIQDGAWKKVGSIESNIDSTMVSVMPQGNLSQLLIYVTPEQFGAIGDGTVHPLSERYSTLSAAQAVYPFVTALTQTIDWAACQAAENYARGKCEIRVAKFKKYQLGDNYLKLGPYSCWIGSPINDFTWETGFIRNVPSDYSAYAFGQLCIVRVGDASEFSGAGVTGENVRNITFKGFQLRWNAARHTASKGIGTMCLHLNYAMKANLDVSLYGGEFACFGYGCWGTQGSIKIDSCHKGVYWDAVSKTPEKTKEGGSTTSHNIELQIDHTVFPVYLRNCNYAKFHGWFEGALTSMPHYDSANETAMGITLDTCDGVIFDMGVEAWQGSVLNCIGSVEANISFGMLPGEVLPDGLGTQGVAYRMRSLMSLPDETAIQTTNRSFTYVNGYSTVTINHFIPAVSNWPTGQTTKYVTSVDTTSKITFQDCGLYLGGAHSLGGSDARLKLAPANIANIEAIGGMYIDRYLKPSSSYDYAGKSVSVHNSWQGAKIAADGTVTITAPTNFKIVDFTAMVGVSTNNQPSGVGIKSSSDTSIVLQTTANASYGITYKLWVKPTL
ncbi:hypothetical protein [Obesumbacterium proteus]|uniref:Phage tail fiber protein n=1 Tax=Obesumbacterium proteus ATCC 12841 TaxID=1354268 RepID=A0AA91EDM4_9GAMM|nr:hypothetical protein [Obesumbacterium proteus]AMO81566.1 hypothetical protein DSM2777_11305 [Obesumbacterium proteus]OAT57365.1 phage tail fiber protein [Obesumbacterium proteus ATCC 12841]